MNYLKISWVFNSFIKTISFYSRTKYLRLNGSFEVMNGMGNFQWHFRDRVTSILYFIITQLCWLLRNRVLGHLEKDVIQSNVFMFPFLLFVFFNFETLSWNLGIFYDNAIAFVLLMNPLSTELWTENYVERHVPTGWTRKSIEGAKTCMVLAANELNLVLSRLKRFKYEF